MDKSICGFYEHFARCYLAQRCLLLPQPSLGTSKSYTNFFKLFTSHKLAIFMLNLIKF